MCYTPDSCRNSRNTLTSGLLTRRSSGAAALRHGRGRYATAIAITSSRTRGYCSRVSGALPARRKQGKAEPPVRIGKVPANCKAGAARKLIYLRDGVLVRIFGVDGFALVEMECAGVPHFHLLLPV